MVRSLCWTSHRRYGCCCSRWPCACSQNGYGDAYHACREAAADCGLRRSHRRSACLLLNKSLWRRRPCIEQVLLLRVGVCALAVLHVIYCTTVRGSRVPSVICACAHKKSERFSQLRWWLSAIKRSAARARDSAKPLPAVLLGDLEAVLPVLAAVRVGARIALDARARLHLGPLLDGV